MDEIRQRIKGYRKDRGLTQANIATAINTSHPTYQRLEQGAISLSLDWINKIAKALDVHPARLLFSKDELEEAINELNAPPPVNQIRIVRKMNGMTLQELADLSGTTYPTIIRLEKGVMKLTMDWAERLAPHLNVHPAQLFFSPSTLSQFSDITDEN